MSENKINNTASPLEQARAFYDRLRGEIETAGNIGKLVSFDINTGAYAIGDDYSLAAPRSLRAKNPDADIVTLRIGYNAVFSLGGVLERTTA